MSDTQFMDRIANNLFWARIGFYGAIGAGLLWLAL